MFYSHLCAHGRLNGPSDVPMVMKWSQRWNTLQICPRRDSNTGGSDLWSSNLKYVYIILNSLYSNQFSCAQCPFQIILITLTFIGIISDGSLWAGHHMANHVQQNMDACAVFAHKEWRHYPDNWAQLGRDIHMLMTSVHDSEYSWGYIIWHPVASRDLNF